MALCLLACGSRGPVDVILITLDTTRADHLGLYGYTRDTAPNLGAFARSAVTYRRAWSTSSWTLPAHASMLTGLHPSSHGADRDRSDLNVSLADQIHPSYHEFRASRLDESLLTLAELLTERGYHTGAFVGGPWLAEPFGLLQGYQHRDDAVETTAGRSASVLTNAALAWIQTVPSDAPLHLFINYFDPHSPYEPPPGFNDLPGAKIPLVVDSAQINAGMPLPADQRTAAIDRYDGEIRFMDHHFGRLLEGLEQAGRLANALVIVTSDHGDLFGEHGYAEHGRWLYEGVLRVPLVVRYPNRRRPGSFDDSTVSLVDLLPLVVEALSMDLPEGVEGVPIGQRAAAYAETLRDPYAVRNFGEAFDRDLDAVVQWPWKLIAGDDGAKALYRLDTDSFETTPVSAGVIEKNLAEKIASHRSGLTRPERAAATHVTPELRDRLRALGYAE